MFQIRPPSPSGGDPEDPIVAAGKELSFARSSSLTTLLYLAGIVFVGIPVWLFVLLPLALLSLPYHLIRKKQPMQQAAVLDPQNPQLLQAVARARQYYQQHGGQSPRRYNLVIFGATGFTGRLGALHLARSYAGGAELRWAIAGRSHGKLEKLAQELSQVALTAGHRLQVDVIVADSFQSETLVPMIANTRCVANMAGPFAAFARPVVQLCAAHGTHYTDITGEVFFVAEMIDRYDELARETGAKIVHMCGHDCIPWSLGVFLAAQALKQRGEQLISARTYSLIKGAVSGGTLRTMFESLEWKKHRPELGYNPLLKDLESQRSTFRTRISNAMFPSFDSVAKSFTGPFIMAPVVARCVVRDNVLLRYGERLSYSDQTVYASFVSGFIQFAGLAIAGTAMVNPLLQWVARKFVLPQPGEGPSDKAMQEGFLKLVTVGKGSNNTTIRSTFWCDKDPGYWFTSIMCVESGLALAANPENPNGVQLGGVYTPAAFAEPIIERLRGANMVLEVQA